MRLEGTARASARAKQLRRELSRPELALWLALRHNPAGLRFRRQHAAGRYVLDFYCAPARLEIEVDGMAHDRGDRPARDEARDAWCRAQGVEVLRVSAAEVLRDVDAVARMVLDVADRRCRTFSARCPPPPSPAAPPPPGGGGWGRPAAEGGDDRG